MLAYRMGGTCSDVYPVEIHDAVDVHIDGYVYQGIVTRLHPRTGEVQVRYWADRYGTCAGDVPQRTARVPVSAIDLLPRAD